MINIHGVSSRKDKLPFRSCSYLECDNIKHFKVLLNVMILMVKVQCSWWFLATPAHCVFEKFEGDFVLVPDWKRRAFRVDR